MKRKIIYILILIIFSFCYLSGKSMAIEETMRLESKKYLILEVKGQITRIIPETELEILKRNFNVAPEELKVYTDETKQKEVTEGYIASGMYLSYEKTKEMYELSVIGDIKKDGILDQIDLNLLIKHVVGLKEGKLEGIDLISADLSGDHKIDQIDITTLIRYLVTKELYIPEIKRPNAPKIEITGTEGENGWYKGPVEVKIIADKESEIEKTIYKVSGDTIVEETEIVAGEKIEITKEGEHKISAYSNSKEGAKSQIVSKTVKIDKEEPSIYITTKAKSKEITVEVQAEDKISGIQNYTYYIGTKNDLGEINWQEGKESTEKKYKFEGLQKDTDYYIKVEVKDNAGNKRVEEKKEHTLNIPDLIDDEKAEEGLEKNVTITKSEENWTNQDVIIKVEVDEKINPDGEYTLEYSKDGETWEKYDPEIGIVVEENADVSIRLTDGENSGKEIVVEIKNIDKKEPTGEMKTVSTKNSIKVEVQAEDDASGIKDYIYTIGKKDENGNIIWEEAIIKPESTHLFENLEPNTEYIIKVEIEDNAGNKKVIQENVYTLEEAITQEVITITTNNENWTKEDVIVTIEAKRSNYTAQYSLDGKTWEDFENKKEITLKENGTVYARIVRNEEIGEVISLAVSNIDRTKPEVNLNYSEVTSKSFKAQMQATDNLSGIAKLVWYYKPATSEIFEEKIEKYAIIGSTERGKINLEKSEKYTELVKGTYQIGVEITDVAGNTTVSETKRVELLEVTQGQEGIEFVPSNINWTNENVTVNILSKDERYHILSSLDQKDWKEQTNYELSQNATVYAKLNDGINNGEETKYEVKNIDKQEVQSLLTIRKITSKSFTVGANITDNLSGLGQIKWYYKNVNDSEYIEIIEDFKEIKGAEPGELKTDKEFTIDNLVKGNYVVYAVITDVAGNSSSVKLTDETGQEIVGGITLETITPAKNAISFKSNNTNWTNTPITITAETSDSRYQIQLSTNETTWETKNTITVNQNGNIYGRLYDGVNAGETTFTTVTNIDTEPITATLTSKNITSKSFVLQLDIQDNDSGLGKIDWYMRKQGESEYKVTSQEFRKVNGAERGDKIATKEMTYENLTSGTYEVYAVITDVAGNSTQVSLTDGNGAPLTGITLETITPGEVGIEITSSNENWINKDVEMTVTTKDSRYEILTSKDNNNWNNESIVNFTENGTIYARLTDGVNVGAIISRKVENIDKTAPQVTMKNVQITSKSFTQKIDVTDNSSGLGQIDIYYKLGATYQTLKTNYQTLQGLTAGEKNTSKNILIDNLKSGSYDVYAIITDVAGNQTRVDQTNELGVKEDITLETITPGTQALTLTPSNTNWTNEPVIINASTKDSRYEIQMSTNGQDWTLQNSLTINANTTVYARLFDGVNGGEAASITINNIDTNIATGRVVSSNVTTKSMDITVTAQDANSGIGEFTLYYQKQGESLKKSNTTKYQTIKGNAVGPKNIEETISLTELRSGTYQIYAEITDVAGNKTTTETISVTLENVTPGRIAINLSAVPTYWTNGNVTVTATSTSNQYILQTSLDANNWGTETTRVVSERAVVYGRLYDGVNGGEAASISINNIDKTAPTVGTISSTAGADISVSLSTSDANSGIAKVDWFYKETTSSSYQKVTNTYVEINSSNAGMTNRTLTQTFSNLVVGSTYQIYADVYDVAGNKATTGTISQVTNRAPENVTASYQNKTTNSITINAKATDPDGNKLTYTLYVSTNQTSGFTNKATATGNSGATVNLTASGLNEYTEYYYYVEASDNIATTKSATGSKVRTYCSGTTHYCSGGSWIDSNCSRCSGSGSVSGSHSKTTSTSTSNCNICGAVYTITTERCACGGYSMSISGSPGLIDESCSTCGGSGRVPCTCKYRLNSTESGKCACGSTYSFDLKWCEDCRGLMSAVGGCLRGGMNCVYPEPVVTGHLDVSCKSCGGDGTISTPHGTCTPGMSQVGCRPYTVNCSSCGGDGQVSTKRNCSHGYWDSHQYCDHGYTSQHD